MVTNWEVEPNQREGRKGEEKIAENGGEVVRGEERDAYLPT